MCRPVYWCLSPWIAIAIQCCKHQGPTTSITRTALSFCSVFCLLRNRHTWASWAVRCFTRGAENMISWIWFSISWVPRLQLAFRWTWLDMEEEDVSVRSRESVHVDWKYHPSRIFQKKPEAKVEIDVRGITKYLSPVITTCGAGKIKFLHLARTLQGLHEVLWIWVLACGHCFLGVGSFAGFWWFGVFQRCKIWVPWRLVMQAANTFRNVPNIIYILLWWSDMIKVYIYIYTYVIGLVTPYLWL